MITEPGSRTNPGDETPRVPHCLILPLTFSLPALGCDDLPTGDADTDAGDTDPGDTDPGSTDPTDSSTGEFGDCPTLDQKDFTGDVTFPAGCYQVPSVVAIDGRVEMEAGAEMYFGTLSTLVVANGGVIIASGTVDAPVLLTAADLSWGGIEDNASTLMVSPNMAADIEASNVFTGNDDAFVRVEYSGADTIEEAGTWAALEVPYRVLERMRVTAAWELAPGAVVEVAQDVNISIDPGGSISAIGTAENPVRSVGAESLRGYWQGIEVHTVTASNVFEHAAVFNAGSDGFNGSDDSDAALFIGGFGGDGSVTIRDTSIESSGGFGISVWDDSQLLGCENVTFSDNEKADVYVQPNGARRPASRAGRIEGGASNRGSALWCSPT